MTATYANRYAGTCARCHQHVPVGQGTCQKDGGRWIVRHLPGTCEPAQAPAAQAAPARRDTPAEVGVYRRDGVLYVVREFTPQDEPGRKVRYAREIIPLTDGQADRLSQRGQRVRVEERKAPGMAYQLAPADALPMEDVKALSIEWSHCLVCGKYIRVAESVERGIGPVCYGRQSALLALRHAAPVGSE